MSYSDDILKMRNRMADAFAVGLFSDENKSAVETMLIQIMNDCEKNRQACVANAESHRRQAGVADGQAQGFASMSSVIYGVINGYVMKAEQAAAEEAARAAEQVAKAADMAETAAAPVEAAPAEVVEAPAPDVEELSKQRKPRRNR